MNLAVVFTMTLANIPPELLPRLCIDPLAAAAMRCTCEAYSAAIPADLFTFTFETTVTCGMILVANSGIYKCVRLFRDSVISQPGKGS